MSIESENTSTSAAEVPATKGPRKSKKAKPAKKAGRAKKAAAKPKADGTSKKAESRDYFGLQVHGKERETE